MSLTTNMVYNAVIGLLDAVKEFVDETKFEQIADKALNNMEGKFKEDGLADKVIEAITGRIRERFDIEDTNPDN